VEITQARLMMQANLFLLLYLSFRGRTCSHMGTFCERAMMVHQGHLYLSFRALQKLIAHALTWVHFVNVHHGASRSWSLFEVIMLRDIKLRTKL
jgi:hypothetical protein